MSVLGGGGSQLQRSASLSSASAAPAAGANKSQRRARLEELNIKVVAVWEALGVTDEERLRFKHSLSPLSSSPEPTLQAYEQEYKGQMKQVGIAVDLAKAQLEQLWLVLGVTKEADERQNFHRKFQCLLAPDHELDALQLARCELVLVQHRVEATRSIQKSLAKRLEILRRLTEAAKEAPGSSAQHDGLRKMVRDYPKIVERLKGHIAKWQSSEHRLWMLGPVSAVEVLDKGDEDVVYRAMHSKLMVGVDKGMVVGVDKAYPATHSVDKGYAAIPSNALELATHSNTLDNPSTYAATHPNTLDKAYAQPTAHKPPTTSAVEPSAASGGGGGQYTSTWRAGGQEGHGQELDYADGDSARAEMQHAQMVLEGAERGGSPQHCPRTTSDSSRHDDTGRNRDSLDPSVVGAMTRDAGDAVGSQQDAQAAAGAAWGAGSEAKTLLMREGREGSREGGREGGMVRKSTTSAMAMRFEALKQTYAQVTLNV